jgi:hypothetical protein
VGKFAATKVISRLVSGNQRKLIMFRHVSELVMMSVSVDNEAW